MNYLLKHFKGCAFLFWCLVSTQIVQAQYFAPNVSHQGKVYLTNDEILEGIFTFDLENETVQISQRGLIKTLHATKVLSFEFFDKFERKTRYYYTLPFPKVSSYPIPTFFELVHQGEPLTLLSREKLVTQTRFYNNPYSLGRDFPVTQTFVKYDFYLLKSNGKIIFLDNSRKGILSYFQDQEENLKEYMKQNRVQTELREDMAGLIDYYNSLKTNN